MAAKAPRKQITLSKYLLRITAISVAATGVLYLLSVGTLKETAVNLAGSVIVQIVKNESEGFYNVSFDKIEVQLLRKQIKLSNFRVYTDSASRAGFERGLETRENMYETHIPVLTLRIRSLYSLYLNKNLQISAVDLQSPEIKWYKNSREDKPVTLSLETGDFYQLITDYLNHFEISDFSITNGSFTYVSDINSPEIAYYIGPVNASVENFEIGQDVNENGDRFLNTDKLTLQISNQSVELADSIHVVEFDDLTLSTETSDIVFTNLKLRPRAEKTPVPDSLNSYEVTVPKFRLTGVDFIRAYNDNTLEIGEIFFDQPTININEVGTKNRARRRKETEGESRSIVELITSLFDVIHVQNFDLQQALLDLRFYGGKNQDRFTVQNTNVRLIDFRVDTATVLFGRDKKVFEHIDFSVDEYTYFLPDSVHRLFVKKFHFSTIDSTISGDSLVIAPLAGLNQGRIRERVDIQKRFFVPSFKLSGVELWKGWEEQDLAVAKLQVSSSSFYLKRLNDPEKKVGIADVVNFYPYIDHIFKKIAIDTLVVNSSEVQFYDRDIQKFSSPGIEVLSRSFLVDSLGQHDSTNFFHADRLTLSMEDSRFVLPDNSHILEVERFDFDPLKGEYEAKNVSISPLSPSGWSASGRVGEVRLSNFFLKELLENGAWRSDSVSLHEPTVQLNFFRKTKHNKRDPFETIEIGRLDVTQGQVSMNLADTASVNLAGYSFGIEGLTYSPQRKNAWRVAEAEASVSGLLITQAGKQLTDIQNISVSLGDSTLTSGSIRFEQRTNQGLSKFSAASISINGLDLPAAVRGEHLVWRNATLGVTDIEWNLPEGGKKNEKKSKELLEQLKEQLLGDFDHIRGTTLRLPLRQLQLTSGTEQRLIGNTDLSLKGFYLDRNTRVPTAPLGFAKELSLSTGQQNLSWLPGFDSLTFQSLTLSTANAGITAKGIYAKMGSEQIIETYSPSVQVVGLDWQALVLDNDLTGDSMSVSLTFLALTDTRKKESKLDLREIKWAGKPVGEVWFDYVNISVADLSVENQGSGTQWRLPGLKLQLEDFDMKASEAMNSQNLFFSRKHELVLSDIAYTLPDSLYTLHAQKVTMKSTAPQLVVDDIEVKPRYGMYEHAEMLGYQTSWMRVTGQQVSVTNANMIDLLTGDALTVGKLELDGFYMRLFRDKRLPFPEGQSRNLPHLQLLSVASPVHFDSVLVKDSKILYLEFAEKGTEPGELFISNLNAWASNVTNHPKVIEANPYIKLHAEALMLDEGLLKADFVFDLANPSGAHYVTGTLGPLTLNKANSILEPSAFVQVRQGNVNQADFNFEADTTVAVGTMNFLYSDLNVSVLSKKEDKKGSGKAFETFFANTFIVSANNPSFFRTREGGIFFERDTSRSIFNYWTKAFLSGIVSSIGAKSNKDEIKQWHQEVYEKNAALQNGNDKKK